MVFFIWSVCRQSLPTYSDGGRATAAQGSARQKIRRAPTHRIQTFYLPAVYLPEADKPAEGGQAGFGLFTFYLSRLKPSS